MVSQSDGMKQDIDIIFKLNVQVSKLANSFENKTIIKIVLIYSNFVANSYFCLIHNDRNFYGLICV